MSFPSKSNVIMEPKSSSSFEAVKAIASSGPIKNKVKQKLPK